MCLHALMPHKASAVILTTKYVCRHCVLFMATLVLRVLVFLRTITDSVFIQLQIRF